MKTVKYMCKKCNYAEEFTKKDYLKSMFVTFFMLIGLTSILLSGAFTFLIYNPSTISDFGKFDLIGFMLSQSGNLEDKGLRTLAINITKGCTLEVEYSSELEQCYVKKIYLFLVDFDYTLGNHKNSKIYTPEETIEFRAGDCKNLAYTFQSLSSQVGVDSRVMCALNHCFNKVKFENNETFLIDVTKKRYGYWEDWEDSYFD